VSGAEWRARALAAEAEANAQRKRADKWQRSAEKHVADACRWRRIADPDMPRDVADLPAHWRELIFGRCLDWRSLAQDGRGEGAG
jgi:uncharacterized protein YbaA (DUF1428 family)